MRLLSAGLILVVLLTGCIGQNSESADNVVWNESDIVQHMGLSESSSGLSWTFKTDNGTTCNVAVVMTTQSQAELYKNAGDVVATNPSGNAGVKVTGGESRTCRDAASELLKDLD